MYKENLTVQEKAVFCEVGVCSPGIGSNEEGAQVLKEYRGNFEVAHRYIKRFPPEVVVRKWLVFQNLTSAKVLQLKFKFHEQMRAVRNQYVLRGSAECVSS